MYETRVSYHSRVHVTNISVLWHLGPYLASKVDATSIVLWVGYEDVYSPSQANRRPNGMHGSRSGAD